MTNSAHKVTAAVLLGSSLLLQPALCDAGPRVFGPAEILERHCVRMDGRLYFAAPSGHRYELITSVDDPDIANPGDGQFHPMPLAEVEAALAGIQYDLSSTRLAVYVLPYPRRGQVVSSAGDGVIFLSPGTRPFAAATVHAVVTHEVGHVVHRAFLPDDDLAGWERYASLRGLLGDARFSATADHAFRPREVFAEDFRALFGSELARNAQGLENPELVWPETVPGLAEFLRSLPERSAAGAAVAASPNPFHARVRLTLDLTRVAPAAQSADELAVAIHDVRGRRVRELPLSSTFGRAVLEWDGADAQGQRLPAGIFFARVTSNGQAARGVPALKIVMAQ